MERFKILVLLTVLSFCGGIADAYANTQKESKKTYIVYFKLNETTIDYSYKNNAETIFAMVDEFKLALQEKPDALKDILIITSASPEGTTALNKYIASKRASNTKRMLLDIFPQLKPEDIQVQSSIYDWEDILDMVKNDSTVSYRKEIMSILENKQLTPSEIYTAFRSRPEVYRYLKTNYLENQRIAKFNVTIVGNPIIKQQPSPEPEKEIPAEISQPSQEPEKEIPAEISQPSQVQDEPQTAVVAVAEPVSKPVFALKTNMLYDVALVPNLGIEAYLGNKYTIAANWMYAWWNIDKEHITWRIYGGDLAIRRWFGQKASENNFAGHHIGVYGQMVTFDFALGNKGYIGERWIFGGGIEYGYSFPIAKKLNLDFNLGVGYLQGEVKEYIPEDTHYVWLKTTDRKWFGPTKAEISLVWLLGGNN